MMMMKKCKVLDKHLIKMMDDKYDELSVYDKDDKERVFTESLSKRYQRLFKSKHNLFNKIHINSTDCAKAKAKITFK